MYQSTHHLARALRSSLTVEVISLIGVLSLIHCVCSGRRHHHRPFLTLFAYSVHGASLIMDGGITGNSNLMLNALMSVVTSTTLDYKVVQGGGGC